MKTALSYCILAPKVSFLMRFDDSFAGQMIGWAVLAQPSLCPEVLLCTRLASQRPGLEPVLRPYVMCHIWAASLVPLVKVSVVWAIRLIAESVPATFVV